MSKFFTSEHVSPGHPDKVMDTIAESIVDFQLEQGYKKPRTAIDGVIKNCGVVLAGECTEPSKIPATDIVKKVLDDIGYRDDVNSKNITSDNFTMIGMIDGQSVDIAQGVDAEETEGAGDIGIMFGGAINEAPDFTGWAHYIARYLSYRFYQYAKEGNFNVFYPDQKVQVTIAYDDNGKALGISEIVLCLSHHDETTVEDLMNIVPNLCKFFLGQLEANGKLSLKYDDYKLQLNPTGKFTIYGPVSDSGEVGRKIVCDQYGGYFAVGGGNLNGKDATKVDRSAVYMARWAAKNVVANQFADKCEIQVSYAIGKKEPVSLNVNCFGTNNVSMDAIEEYVRSNYDFIPGHIIEQFKLNKPLSERGFSYEGLGKYGHIGFRFDGNEVPWESINLL